MPTKHEKSAAAVIFHKAGTTTEYLLLHYPSARGPEYEGHWGHVKGHIEADESKKETLLREAREETGLSKKKLKFINNFKEKIEYWFKKEGNLIHKTVDFFLLESDKKEISLSEEHDDYAWLEYEEAKERLTFDNAKEVLAKASTHL